MSKTKLEWAMHFEAGEAIWAELMLRSYPDSPNREFYKSHRRRAKLRAKRAWKAFLKS